jgi:hypothetical protein
MIGHSAPPTRYPEADNLRGRPRGKVIDDLTYGRVQLSARIVGAAGRGLLGAGGVRKLVPFRLMKELALAVAPRPAPRPTGSTDPDLAQPRRNKP